jgi:hypothetical protein
MTDRRFVPRHALEAVLGRRGLVKTLDRALWLYLAMVLNSGSNGTVVRTRKRFAEDLGVPEEDVDAWLPRLVDSGLVRVFSPAPYLVVKLESWSGASDANVRSSREKQGNAAAAREVFEDSNSFLGNTSNAIAIGDGGAGEGASLLKTARRVLGDLDDDELRVILEKHPPKRVARALDRVEKTPPERIRKSKLALFRYLLVRIKDV